MAEKYLWDVEELTALSTKFKSQLEVLQDNKSFLSEVDENVKQCWSSISAETFYTKMDFDIETFEKVISFLEKQISCLDNVISYCYQECETQVESKLNDLLNNIS